MNDDVKIIVLRTDRGEGKPNADTDLFGRTLEQWVVSAMRGMETETVEYKDGDDFFMSHKGKTFHRKALYRRFVFRYAACDVRRDIRRRSEVP